MVSDGTLFIRILTLPSFLHVDLSPGAVAAAQISSSQAMEKEDDIEGECWLLGVYVF